MKSFKHSGDLGDIIFSLPTIRALGGGVLYLDPKGGEEEPLVEWTAHNKSKLTEERINSIKSLLEYQTYISEVKLWDGEKIDYNLDIFRHHIIYNNLSDSHLAPFDLPFSERDRAWLQVPSVKKPAEVIFARSSRYHGNYSFWEQLDQSLIEKAVFLGYEKEHEYFKYTFPRMKGVPLKKVQNIMEMAQVIAGCGLFVGNVGLPHALAEGMKKTLISEVYRVYPPATFEREGATYV